MDKNKLRKKIIDIRDNIAPEKQKIKSDEIYNSLIKTKEFINSNVIGIYISFNNEVETESIINYCFSNNKRVVIPRIITDTKIEFLEIGKDYKQKLIPNKWGLPEPTSNNFVKKNLIELIIVPLVVFDNKNNRIGYGKGFYDRYLADFNGYKIGLAFSEQKSPKLIKINKFDIKLDKILYY